ncbi:hypothetical protein DAI22_03g225001 [Oryza sativa Japonica Group]|nr:hypothetical protein DAI22_03g225001 [Oryza sativa Japonica Group]
MFAAPAAAGVRDLRREVTRSGVTGARRRRGGDPEAAVRGGRRREGEGRGDCGELSGTTRGERGEGSAAGEAGGAATWLVRRAGGGDTAWGGRAVAWGGRSGGDVLFFSVFS